MPTTIYLVRHAHVHNPRSVVYGRLPRFRISDEGQVQLRATSEALCDRPLAAIWSSPLLRARQTAFAIRRFHPLAPLRLSELLIEVRSRFEGRLSEEVDWDEAYIDAQAPYEREHDVVSRMQRFLRRTRREYSGRQVAAVSHGDPIYFTILTSFGLKVSGVARPPLTGLGLSEDYPAVGSITTLTYASPDPDERPHVQYLRPY